MRKLGTALILLAATSAEAQDFEGARLLGVAGGRRSAVTGNDAIFINPAGMALGQAYSIEANFGDDLASFERIFAGSIMDSQAGPIAAGLSYVFTDRSLEETPDGAHIEKAHRGDLALATRVADSAALGVTLRYVSIDEERGDTELEGYDLFTLDAGFQYQQRGGGFSLGLAGYNLTNPDRPPHAIAWGGGLGYSIDWFAIAADVRHNAKIGKPRVSGSLQLTIAQVFPLRAGLAYDLTDDSMVVSGGLGYESGGFGVDVGYRERVIDGKLGEDAQRKRMLGFALRITVF